MTAPEGLEPVGDAMARSWYRMGRQDGRQAAEPMPILPGIPDPLARAYHDGYQAGRAEAGLRPGASDQPPEWTLRRKRGT